MVQGSGEASVGISGPTSVSRTARAPSGAMRAASIPHLLPRLALSMQSRSEVPQPGLFKLG